MKKLFTKPEHVSTSFGRFFGFTVISMIIGIVVKIIVLAFSGEALAHAYDMPKIQRENVPGGDPMVIEGTMTFMQILIMILTLVVYPKSLGEQTRLLKDSKHKFTRRMYKSFVREYIIFLVVFIFLDIMSIGTLAYYKVKTDFPFDFKTYIIIFSILIPTPLAIGSLVGLRKLRLAGEVDMTKIEKSKKAKVRA